jgi:virginiamycin B lyase
MSAATIVTRRRGFRPGWPRAALTVFALLLLAGGGALAWRFGPWSGPGFVEYAMPRESDIPTALAVAPDGAIWFTIEAASELGVFRDGRIATVGKGPKSLEPFGIAVDAAGNVWFTDAQARSVSRRSPDGTIARFAVPSPTSKLGRLAVAPDGSVWLADGDLNSLVEIRDGVVIPHELPTLQARPFGVAVGPDGTVWATLQRANKLARLSPGGQVAEIDVPTRGGEPIDVAVDGAGAVWFTQFRGNKIGRFAGGQFVEYAVPTPQAGVSAIAVAPDGAVWFAETRSQKLGRLRDGVIAEFPLPRADARPLGIAVDRVGNVWYTDIKGRLGALPAERAR